MRELSILKEVEKICKSKLSEGFSYINPWKILDGYDERATEQRYRFQRERQIDMLQKTMIGRYKRTRTSLNRFLKEIYIIKYPSTNKYKNGFQHARCKDRIKFKHIEKRKEWKRAQMARMSAKKN